MSDISTFVVLLRRDDFPPPCEWSEHWDKSCPHRHDDGPAKFELLSPCGFTSKVCSAFMVWFQHPGSVISCRENGVKHTFADVMVVPL